MNPVSAGAVRLRPDLPFRRVALVLSGGGALGAYEAGVLRVIESAGLAPSIVAGVSIGAVNAAVWVAHGRRTAALERAWRTLSASSLGIRWITLAWRWLGAAVVLLALLQLVLILTGSRELSGAYWLWGRSSGRADIASTMLEAAAWLVVGVLGVAAVMLARHAEEWAARLSPRADPARLTRWLGRAWLVLFAVHTTFWVMGWPWPHRFVAIVLIGLGGAWLANRPGRTGEALRDALKKLHPESAGRGLWGSAGRRTVIEELVGAGGPAGLPSDDTLIVVSALAIDSGRVCHFTMGPDPGEAFVKRVERERGEVVRLRDPEDLIRAVVASSAIPGLFEPVRIGGRDFVDTGGFSNQPLHVAIAADADAALAVLLAPFGTGVSGAPPSNLLELGGRLLEIANWRDMQAELRDLPDGWSREGDPARLCLVEPVSPLPGGLLGFDPDNAAELIALGERDARAALARAGWLADESARAAT